MQYYGINLYDRSVYDIVIDTSDIAPEEVVEVIIAKLGELTC
jgi:cytidylate kinase